MRAGGRSSAFRRRWSPVRGSAAAGRGVGRDGFDLEDLLGLPWSPSACKAGEVFRRPAARVGDGEQFFDPRAARGATLEDERLPERLQRSLPVFLVDPPTAEAGENPARRGLFRSPRSSSWVSARSA
jgi:hypothetical protein